MKRGQVTMFIVVGIVILIVVGATFFIIGSVQEKRLESERERTVSVPPQFRAMKVFTELCIEGVGRDALVFVGKRGGYYELPALSNEFVDVAYYFFIQNDTMISKERLEEEISAYVNENLLFCLKNFYYFSSVGFDITWQEVSTQTTIVKDRVLFDVRFPITITKEDLTKRFDKFSATLAPHRLFTVYNVSRTIIDKQLEASDLICLSCLIQWGIENDLLIDMFELTNDSILFEITDNNSKINGLPYLYRFVNKYNVSVEEELPTVEIRSIPDQVVNLGEPFSYEVLARGVNITYSDDTDLFDINASSGLINFTPTLNQAGEHLVVIHAIDAYGNEDTALFIVTISSENTPPFIGYIGYHFASRNVPFVYRVNASDAQGDAFNFTDNADLFNISTEGLINFTPQQTGFFAINITATDAEGASSMESMFMVIT